MASDPPTRPQENRLRLLFCGGLGLVEVSIYMMLGLLLSLTGLIALGGVVPILWESAHHLSQPSGVFKIMDRLLFVLMLVEILHTVRISIRSHRLVTEPFLIVGLIASIRRMLVITLEAASLTEPAKWTAGGAAIFRASMLELTLLAFLVLSLVVSICLLRRHPAAETSSEAGCEVSPAIGERQEEGGAKTTRGPATEEGDSA